MFSQNSAATAHTFQAHDADTLLSEVTSVRCILLAGSLTIAGYSDTGAVLAVKHHNYASPRNEWMPNFFEHLFLHEPLLAMAQQVSTVFIGSAHQLIVPDVLYDAAESGKWLRALYHLHPEDSVLASEAKSEEAHYLLSMPVKMQALLHKYFPSANVLPLAAYQFKKPAGAGSVVRCLISGNEVMGTLHRDEQLLWHQLFQYDDVSDIAWQFARLCKEYDVPPIDLKLEVATLCDGCYDDVLELETFFPKIKWAGKEHSQGEWSPVNYLLQQLYECA